METELNTNCLTYHETRAVKAASNKQILGATCLGGRTNSTGRVSMQRAALVCTCIFNGRVNLHNIHTVFQIMNSVHILKQSYKLIIQQVIK
jgi:hypothetical protein